MLASPLPTIGVDLVHTQVLAATKLGTHTTSSSSPSLPRTGAATGATVLAGLALAGGALLVRRYVVARPA
jgi:LPXTG-motif cell wall-anchored protein